MKHIACLLTAFLFVQHVFAQDEAAELKKLKIQWTAEIEAEMARKGIGAANPEEWSMESDSLIAVYERDTFLLERLFEYQLEHDQTTYGMVQAMVDCEAGYDALLNKYYKMLLSRLEGTDKETLKKAQRSWIAFRDSEQELNGLLTDEKYSGGGSIQRLNYASRNLALTQSRVEELFLYLVR